MRWLDSHGAMGKTTGSLSLGWLCGFISSLSRPLICVQFVLYSLFCVFCSVYSVLYSLFIISMYVYSYLQGVWSSIPASFVIRDFWWNNWVLDYWEKRPELVVYGFSCLSCQHSLFTLVYTFLDQRLMCRDRISGGYKLNLCVEKKN